MTGVSFGSAVDLEPGPVPELEVESRLLDVYRLLGGLCGVAHSCAGRASSANANGLTR